MADSGEAGESDGEERDSRASIMSRGGKHEDTSALGKMMGTVQAWVDNPLTAAQIDSEDARDGRRKTRMMRRGDRWGLRSQVLQLRRDRLTNKEPVG